MNVNQEIRTVLIWNFVFVNCLINFFMSCLPHLPIKQQIETRFFGVDGKICEILCFKFEL